LRADRLPLHLNELLSRSYPRQGDEDRVRVMFAQALRDDFLDVAPHSEQQKVFFSIPVAILAAGVALDP
jgi:hypothetical protein